MMLRTLFILPFVLLPLFAHSAGFDFIDKFPLPSSDYTNTYPEYIDTDAEMRETVFGKSMQVEGMNAKLTGVFQISKKFVALINGEPYEIDDEIEGFTITAIDIASAVLEKRGRKVILYVENEE